MRTIKAAALTLQYFAHSMPAKPAIFTCAIIDEVILLKIAALSVNSDEIF
jgi:hypothetical protein